MSGKVNKPFYKRVWFWVIVAIVVIGAAGVNGSDDTESASTETKDTATKATETKEVKAAPKQEEKQEEKKEEKKETNKKTISMDEFKQIENGMSKEEVEKIIGGAGTLDSSAGDGQFKTEIYSWKGDSWGANANVTFQDGKVQGKAQFGLDQ